MLNILREFTNKTTHKKIATVSVRTITSQLSKNVSKKL